MSRCGDGETLRLCSRLLALARLYCVLVSLGREADNPDVATVIMLADTCTACATLKLIVLPCLHELTCYYIVG